MIRAFRAHAREHRASILVAALSSAFGVALIACINVLAAYIRRSDFGDAAPVQLALGMVATVFFTIAVYVGAIVTTNTFATVIAGRTRTIALMRLIGSGARAQRRSVAGEGLVAGLLGSLAGAAAGSVLSLVAVRALTLTGGLPDARYPVLTPALIAPIVIVVAATWLSSWVGSRRVLTVTPIEALGAAQERPAAAVRGRARLWGALLLLFLGVVLLGAGLLLGLGVFSGSGGDALALLGPFGVLVALVGGVLSFTGLLLIAPLILPSALRRVGLLLDRGVPGRLAAANAVRNPERSSRSTIGLIIGVTLVTMFVVAAESWLRMIRAAAATEPDVYAGAESVLTAIMLVFSVLVGFSGLIAAVGLVNSLSLSVLQRRRELGLLRALGLSVGQVRRMILAEGASLAVTAVLIGLGLGTLYGWIGAQSLLGQIPGGGLIPPAMPWSYLAGIAVAAAALSAGASVVPIRRATRLSPIAALTVEEGGERDAGE